MTIDTRCGDDSSIFDPPTHDAPEPLKVSHGWSMMGYYYVNVTTGAERGPFP